MLRCKRRARCAAPEPEVACEEAAGEQPLHGGAEASDAHAGAEEDKKGGCCVVM